MWKNVLLLVYTGLLVIFVILLSSGKLGWIKSGQLDLPDRVAVSDLERAVQFSQPQLFEIGDKKLICAPYIKVHGEDYSIKYNFFEYVEGKLKAVEYSNR